ncbi:MAG: glycosyltransferase, partial [Terriglobia bacterium]
YLGIWPAWLADPAEFLPWRVRTTGFILPDEVCAVFPDSLQNFLSRNLDPVLIAGGTGTFAGPAFFRLAIAACNRIHVPAIVVCRRHELMPDPLPAGIHWEFAVTSLFALMRRVSTVIHHGGMGTAAEACAAGVPQVVFSSGADRTHNALRLERLGLAVKSGPNDAPEVLAAKLNIARSSPRMKRRCAQMAERIRCDTSASTFFSIVEDVCNGCFCQSRLHLKSHSRNAR